MATAPGPQGAPDPITQPLAIGQPYDPAPAREKVRGWLALGLVAAVILLTFSVLALLAIGRITAQDVPGVAGVASPIAGIAGAAIGFYFGGDPRR